MPLESLGPLPSSSSLPMATSSTDSPAEGLSVYVDEQIGSDEAGDGTIQKPYHSGAQAILNHGPSPPLNILTRKSETEEWTPIGVSALKKARKGAEGMEKKKKKALEAEAKASEKAAEQAKTKDTILEEDMSLPEATKVGSSNLNLGGNTHPAHRRRSNT